MTDNSLHWSKR